MVDMSISAKFIGSLKNFFEKGDKIFDYKTEITVKELINSIIEKKPGIKDFLVSGQNSEYRLNSLVLINDIEISALNGIDTKLSDGDKITFIPVIHGG